MTFADQRADVLFPKGKRIIRTQQNPLRTHRTHQELQCGLVKHGGVNIETIQIMTWWKLARSSRYRMMVPRVLQPTQQKGKTSTTMRKTDPQCRRQAVESSASNQRHQ